MSLLKGLEEKVSSLLKLVQELKTRNEALIIENKQLKVENQELKVERSLLIDEKRQLTERLSTLENSVLEGNERIEETKLVVDDIIRSIGVLVEDERQQ